MQQFEQDEIEYEEEQDKKHAILDVDKFIKDEFSTYAPRGYSENRDAKGVPNFVKAHESFMERIKNSKTKIETAKEEEEMPKSQHSKDKENGPRNKI